MWQIFTFSGCQWLLESFLYICTHLVVWWVEGCVGFEKLIQKFGLFPRSAQLSWDVSVKLRSLNWITFLPVPCAGEKHTDRWMQVLFNMQWFPNYQNFKKINLSVKSRGLQRIVALFFYCIKYCCSLLSGLPSVPFLFCTSGISQPSRIGCSCPEISIWLYFWDLLDNFSFYFVPPMGIYDFDCSFEARSHFYLMEKVLLTANLISAFTSNKTEY